MRGPYVLKLLLRLACAPLQAFSRSIAACICGLRRMIFLMFSTRKEMRNENAEAALGFASGPGDAGRGACARQRCVLVSGRWLARPGGRRGQCAPRVRAACLRCAAARVCAAATRLRAAAAPHGVRAACAAARRGV